MKQPIFLLLFLLFANNCVLAGKRNGRSDSTLSCKYYKNSVVLGGTNYYFPDIGPSNLLLPWHGQQLGAYYQRQIYKHINIKAGYSQWNTKWYSNSVLDNEFKYGPRNDTLKVGAITSCGKYKMADIFVGYTIYVLEKHAVNICLGVSYTWGQNDRIDSIIILPGNFDALISSSLVQKHFYGIVPSISYGYLFLKKRLDVGVDIRYRKYFGYYLKTFEYGIHIGVNF